MMTRGPRLTHMYADDAQGARYLPPPIRPNGWDVEMTCRYVTLMGGYIALDGPRLFLAIYIYYVMFTCIVPP